MTRIYPRGFYTYLWLREDGTPYYVGKGHGGRAGKSHRNVGKAPSHERILAQSFPSEQDALAAEQFLISFYGRKDLDTGCLINFSDGGEGAPNPSPQSRRRTSERLRIDLTGRVFGRLQVREFNYEKSVTAGRPCWDCVCSCGGKKTVSATHLRMGDQKSCGCIKREMAIARNKTLPNLGKHYRKKVSIRPRVLIETT